MQGAALGKVPDDGPEITRDGIISNQLVKKYGNGKSIVAGYNDHMDKILYLLKEKDYTFSSAPGEKRLWKLRWRNPRLQPPSIMPIHCYERGLTYGKNLLATAVIELQGSRGGEAQTKELTVDIDFGLFPILLGSEHDPLAGPDKTDLQLLYGEDPDDPGLYFIVEGNAYTFVRSEGVRFNTVVCYQDEKPEKKIGASRPSGGKGKGAKAQAGAAKKAKAEKTILISALTTESKFGKTSLITMYVGRDNILRFASFRYLGVPEKGTKNFPVLGIFRALEAEKLLPEVSSGSRVEEFILGFTRPEWRDMIRVILAPSLQDYLSTDEAGILKQIKSIRKDTGKTLDIAYYRELIVEDLYSHLDNSDLLGKLALLSHQLIRHLEVYLGLRKMDDRNSFSVKRFNGAGMEMYHLFVRYLEHRIGKIADPKSGVTPYVNPAAALENLEAVFANNNMTVQYAYAFKKNWQLKDVKAIRTRNYSEALKAEEFLQLHFHVNKVVRTRDPHTKSYAIRGVHGTQTGYEDPSETPESERAGLNNTAALLEFDSRPNDDENVIEFLLTSTDAEERRLVRKGHYKRGTRYNTLLIVNGKVIGVCQGEATSELLVVSRRDRVSVPLDAGIFYDADNHYLYLNTDAGRPTQLLYIVNKETGRLIAEEKNLLEKEDAELLLTEGAIAFVDSREKEFAYVAQSRAQMRVVRRDIKNLRQRIKDLRTILDNFEEGKYVHGIEDADQIITKEVRDREVTEKKRELTAMVTPLITRYGELVEELKALLEQGQPIDNFYDRYTALVGEIERLQERINFYDPKQYDTKPTLTLQKMPGDPASEYLSREQVVATIERARLRLQRLLAHSHFDYCEIDEAIIYGITSSCLNYIHKIPGPRQVFGAKMVKQAEGCNNISARWRFVPTKTLIFPCRSVCKTQTETVIGLNRHPVGVPVVLAMMTQEGFTIEDALAVSKGFLQRNGFLSVTKKEITEAYEKTGEVSGTDGSTVSTHFTNDIPQDIRSRRPPDAFDKLDERGIVKPGSVLKVGDCIIGSYQRIKNRQEITYKDSSVYIKRSKVGTVSKVLLNNIGKPTVTIEIEQVRVPAIGDKFSSFQAQKGVLGKIIPDEDCPYILPEEGAIDGALAGVTPDFYMDPPSQPSRMTVGMLKDEILGSKVAVASGKSPDSTAFRKEDVEYAERELKAIGLNHLGEERVCVKGKVLRWRIYTGIVTYLRLVHEAVDKVQNRYLGSYMARTRQPITGIDNMGGQRYGEMEIEAPVTYGASGSVSEYLSRLSDYYVLFQCARCNTEVFKDKGGIYYCPVCEKAAELIFTPTTYVEKMRSLYAAGTYVSTLYISEPLPLTTI